VGRALEEAARLIGAAEEEDGADDKEDEAGRGDGLGGTMAAMLHRLHGSVNTLTAVDSLEAQVDAACVQAALRLPLPMPRLVEMADFRCGRDRSDAARARVLVPYDVFLRQLVAYEAAAAAGVGARSGGGGSSLPSGDEAADRAEREAEAHEAAARKQRMLVRERLGVAQAMARPWIRALGRGGFTRIGQLVKMPRLELQRSLASAYPLKPEAGVTLAGRRAQEVAACVPPSRAAAAIEAALEHWVATRPDIADAVYLRVSAFDPRFQKSSTDAGAAGPAARAYGAEAAKQRQLSSADWRAFERQRYGYDGVTHGTEGARTAKQQQGRLRTSAASTVDGGARGPPGMTERSLVAPLGFSTAGLRETQDAERRRLQAERRKGEEFRGGGPPTRERRAEAGGHLDGSRGRTLPPPVVMQPDGPPPAVPPRSDVSTRRR